MGATTAQPAKSSRVYLFVPCCAEQMTISLNAITDISHAVALEHGRGLQVTGVTSTDGGTERVELLVTIMGCHSEPCRLLINVSRAERAEFEREFRSKLDAALRAHNLNR